MYVNIIYIDRESVYTFLRLPSTLFIWKENKSAQASRSLCPCILMFNNREM